jgi:hypothetical protein
MRILLGIGYIAMGLFQISATYDFFYRYWGWPFVLAGFGCLILGYMPFIGSICGMIGAM